MEVTINLSKADLLRFNLEFLPRDKSTYISILVFSLLVAFIIVFSNGFPETPKKNLLLLAVSLIGGTVGTVVGMLCSLVYILLTSSDKAGHTGEHYYKITEEGLYEKTSANEGLNRWSGISQIKVTKSFILFRISGYLFHVIPKQSFASTQAYDAFAEQADKFWNSAHEK